MIRYILSAGASRDLTDIRSYLQDIPRTPGTRIALEIKQALRVIAGNPFLGSAHSEFTRLAGQEIRSWPVASYRIYYHAGGSFPEILAVLHTARDHHSILRGRIQ